MSWPLETLLEKAEGFVFPTGKDERWRFSHLKPWQQVAYADTPEPYREEPQRFDTPYRILIEDGALADASLPEGVYTTDQTEAPTHPENPFSPLLKASGTGGIALRCERSFTRPLHILYRYGSKALVTSRLSLRVEKGADVEVIESFEGAEEGFLVHQSRFLLEAGARMAHTQLQLLHNTAAAVTEMQLGLEPQAGAELFLLQKGAAFNQHFLQCIEQASSAMALSLLQLGDASQRQVFCSDAIHEGRKSSSEQLARHLLDGESIGVFDATTTIRNEAVGAQARQSTNALLLNDLATVHAKPHLKIYVDELRASHGATVGQLDAGALAYLQSRGIPEAKARAMLIEAFVRESAEQIRAPDIRAWVLKLIGAEDA
jgi:Fe-S cluster assembly protein SufD